MTTMREAKIFVKHIQKHLNEMDEIYIKEPMCKICGKYLSEILQEEKEQKQK